MLSVVSAFVGLVVWVISVSHRVDTGMTRILAIEEWQQHMEGTYLPSTYARRDLMDAHLRKAEESNLRVENLVREVKADLRESMHALRTDLIVLVKKDLEK